MASVGQDRRRAMLGQAIGGCPHVAGRPAGRAGPRVRASTAMAMGKVHSSPERLPDGTEISLVLMQDGDGWRFAWWRAGRSGDADGLSQHALASKDEARKAALRDAAAQLSRS